MDLVGGVVTAGPHLHVLVLNCGSSSLKFGLFETGPARLATLVSGEAAAIGQPRGAFSARDASGREISEKTALMDYKHVIDRVLQLFADCRAL